MTETALNWSELQERLNGAVITPGDPRYDGARRVWNGMIDRHPSAVVRCADERDVAASLAFARDAELMVAVRGGSHSVAGTSTCDDGLVIDLGSINHCEVDGEAGIVRVGGGALLRDVDQACQLHGLVVPAGVVSHTGVGGLTLGGGVGWLTRKYGLTCDNLLEARVLLANGEFVNASEDELPELLWALRGGGGNFGIVTEFTFRCHPLPTIIPVAFGYWSIDDAPAVLRAYDEHLAEQPNDVKASVFFCQGRGSDVPDELAGKPYLMIIQVCADDDLDMARRAMQPLTDAAKPAGVAIEMTRFLSLQGIDDDTSGYGKGNYTKGAYLDALPDGAIDALIAGAEALTSPESVLELIPHGGAQLEIGEDESAFSNRDARYSLNLYSRWPLDQDSAPHIEWARAGYRLLEPYMSTGVYTNFFAVDDLDERVVAAYGPRKYQRLAGLKARFDPDNVFSLNGNIKPAPLA